MRKRIINAKWFATQQTLKKWQTLRELLCHSPNTLLSYWKILGFGVCPLCHYMEHSENGGYKCKHCPLKQGANQTSPFCSHTYYKLHVEIKRVSAATSQATLSDAEIIEKLDPLFGALIDELLTILTKEDHHG